MDREQALELFSAYKEGELSPDQLAAFEELLEKDAACREEYEAFCKVLESLASLTKEPAPAGFADKVKGRIRRRSGGRLFGMGGGTRVPYEIFSLVLILIILTVYLLTMQVTGLSSPPAGEQDSNPSQQPLKGDHGAD